MPDVDWIRQNTGTRAVSSHLLIFEVAKNEDYDNRSAQIVIKDVKSSNSETITVNQSGSSIIELTQHEYTVGYEGKTITTEVKSNWEYEVIMPDVDWIKQNTETRAVSTRSLCFDIARNEEYDNRSAQIVIKDLKSDNSAVITINQLQKDAMFVVGNEYSVEAEGGDVMIQLLTNVKCSAQIPLSCSWIHVSQSTMTRGLNDESITLTVDRNNTVEERSAEIVLTDSKSISKTITVKQKPQMIILETSSLTMMSDTEKVLTCQINQSISSEQLVWTSSNTDIVTVSQSGVVSAKKKGNATVVVKTQDGRYSASCTITVGDITDYVSARNLGGSIRSINGLIQYGSVLNWGFYNNSNETVLLKTMQLIDGQTGYEGNLMSVGVDVAGGSSVAYSTTIGFLGIHAPVTCRFRFEYNGKEYSVDAVYNY